jgi:hypothetical protein
MARPVAPAPRRAVVADGGDGHPDGHDHGGHPAGLEEQARRRGDLQPLTIANSRGYEYRRDEAIGGGFAGLAEAAMTALRENPNDFFPFDVRPSEDSEDSSIAEKRDYILEGRPDAYFLLPGRFPVRVTKVTPTSFTFTVVEEGHFDPPGSTITFTTYQGETWILDLLEGVCAGNSQARFEYPATSVLFSTLTRVTNFTLSSTA